MTDTISKTELRKIIDEIVSGDDLDTISTTKVLRQLGGKLRSPFGERKKEIEHLVAESVEHKIDAEMTGKGDKQHEKEELKRHAIPHSKEKPSKRSTSHGDVEDFVVPDKEQQVNDEAEYRPDEEDLAQLSKDEEEAAYTRDGRRFRGGHKRRSGGSSEDEASPSYQQRGILKPHKLSPELAKMMGTDTMSRQEVVKKMWTIIKERNLYDPKNKQYAICDDELMKVFGEKRIHTFGMMKYLEHHFVE